MNKEIVRVFTKYDTIPTRIIYPKFDDESPLSAEWVMEITPDYHLYPPIYEIIFTLTRKESGIEGVVFCHYEKIDK